MGCLGDLVEGVKTDDFPHDYISIVDAELQAIQTVPISEKIQVC